MTLGFLDDSVGKESDYNIGNTEDTDLITGLGRSPRGGNDNLFQDSCLKNPMVR